MSASDYITWRRWAYYNSDPVNNPRGDQPNSTIKTKFISQHQVIPQLWQM